MTSAFQSTEHDLTFTAERAPQRDLNFTPVIPAKMASAFRRLLPASMIVLGAFATVGWGALLLWSLFRIVLTMI
jgi:hypothetical protein